MLTADRGLCGGFNTNICKLAKKHFRQILNDGKNLKIISVGSKGYDQIKKEFSKYVIEKRDFKNIKNITFDDAQNIGKIILELLKIISLINAFYFSIILKM